MRTSSLLATLAATGLALGAGAITLVAHGRSSTPAPAVSAPVAKGPTPATCHDEDGDGYGLGCARGDDCNDHDATVHPGQTESCNLRDDDCNGIVDDSASCSSPAVNVRARVLVPAGSFLMGSTLGANDEKPEHRVSGPAFEMDRFEVTNARYKACVDAGACAAPKLRASHLRPDYFDNDAFGEYPVIFVDHGQAETFCKAEGGRLPTEAEWERAARGVDAPRTFPWGDKAPDCTLANMGGAGSCVGDTDRVGRRPEGASPYGADDMAGNVWEWTSDWYAPDYYGKSAVQDPKGPATGRLKVMRGGCWVSGADSLRSTCRKAELPSTWAYNVGFRCVYATKGGDR
jgi:formylglycine-generating enzyme required for sulfatase activity